MSNVDPLILNYQAIKPKTFQTLVKFETQQVFSDLDNVFRINIFLQLRPYDLLDNRILELIFFEVQDLHWNPLLGTIAFSLLEIFSIKEQQMENLYYKVADTEDNQLSFYCKSFTATII